MAGEQRGRGNPSLLQCPYCARCGNASTKG
jgi:hypothetical protein